MPSILLFLLPFSHHSRYSTYEKSKTDKPRSQQDQGMSMSDYRSTYNSPSYNRSGDLSSPGLNDSGYPASLSRSELHTGYSSYRGQNTSSTHDYSSSRVDSPMKKDYPYGSTLSGRDSLLSDIERPSSRDSFYSSTSSLNRSTSSTPSRNFSPDSQDGSYFDPNPSTLSRSSLQSSSGLGYDDFRPQEKYTLQRTSTPLKSNKGSIDDSSKSSKKQKVNEKKMKIRRKMSTKIRENQSKGINPQH